jgi:hypothetical protein
MTLTTVGCQVVEPGAQVQQESGVVGVLTGSDNGQKALVYANELCLSIPDLDDKQDVKQKHRNMELSPGGIQWSWASRVSSRGDELISGNLRASFMSGQSSGLTNPHHTL